MPISAPGSRNSRWRPGEPAQHDERRAADHDGEHPGKRGERHVVDHGIGSCSASMAMKCIDQMPVPIENAPPSSQSAGGCGAPRAR